MTSRSVAFAMIVIVTLMCKSFMSSVAESGLMSVGLMRVGLMSVGRVKALWSRACACNHCSWQSHAAG